MFNTNPIHLSQKLDNVNIVIDFLVDQCNISLISIGEIEFFFEFKTSFINYIQIFRKKNPKDSKSIVGGNLKMTLALIWNIISQFGVKNSLLTAVSPSKRGSKSAFKMLTEELTNIFPQLAFCQGFTDSEYVETLFNLCELLFESKKVIFYLKIPPLLKKAST